ncbi:MAG TPA: efflux RND transporter periplasmic adaptor subunit [Hyphomicrobiaceae bacterium]|nr:efflux RND transporter periplasmic adaptor subunit [Hyphomicrobiaceae bacterium]
MATGFLKRGLTGCLWLTLALAAAGCDSPQPSQAKAPGGSGGERPAVSVSQPLKRQIVEWDEYTGRFDAVAMVEVRARVSGHLTEVHFKDGQDVKPGDLLYEIDPRPFERVLDQARAELLQAQTRVDNANLDVVRGKPLLDRRVISEKTFDDRENLVREAQAQVKVAEAKVKAAELDLSFARIEAPIQGRISRSMVTAGNWVSGGGASNSTMLTSIVSQDPIYIYFDVSENNYIKYKRLAERGESAGAADLGSTVELAMPDERGFPHRGKLDFLDNRLDQGTGTLRARAVVANAAGFFAPGMFARVRVTGTAPYPALLIPDEAIGTDQTNKYVYVVADNGQVARRNIQLGPLIDGLRVAREGVADGDWVITKGLHRARPGQSVTPNRVALTLSSSQPSAGTPASKVPQ